MIYLALEMTLWLAVAAFVGLVAGWLLRSALRPRAAQADDPSLVARLTAAEADFESRALAADAAIARLKADLHVASSRANALESDGGKRFTEMESALRMQVRAAEALASERGHALEQTRNMFNTAQGEWSHRTGVAEDRAAEAQRRAEDAERRIAALAAELAEAKAVLVLPAPSQAAAPDRADEIERLDAERDALLAERDVLRDRLAASLPAKAARVARAGDDLTAVEGLGPAMSKALKANGVETYEALAALSQEDAKALGSRMRNRFADRFLRESWAEKARALVATKAGG